MSSVLQSKQWADFKASQGFEIIKMDDLFIHKRNLPLDKNFLYIPEASSSDINGNQVELLKDLTRKEKSIFLRLEMIDRFGENAQKILTSMGFVGAFEQIQPKWRQVVNLRETRGVILSKMKQKGRYNVKLAEKKGVTVVKRTLDGKNADQGNYLRNFFAQYNNTVQREKIGGRSFDYFEKMAAAFTGTDYLAIYLAYFENKPLSSALISFYDGVASYLYGGSSNENREVMAPYLLHWHIMLDAKERGCSVYDLIGRSRPGAEDSWAGLTRFKEQFGGEAVEILGSFDFVNKPLWYKIFMAAEKTRRK